MITIPFKQHTPQPQSAQPATEFAALLITPLLALLTLVAVTLPATAANTGANPSHHSFPNPEQEPLLLDRYSLRSYSRRTRLPKALREVSGLVIRNSSELLLHDDNNSALWRFNYQTGELGDTLSSAAPVKGDFEGIAALTGSSKGKWLLSDSGARLHLFDAAGKVLASPTLNNPGFAQPGFIRQCNFEGLAVLPQQQQKPQELLIPCKYPFFEQAGLAAAEDHLVYLFRHNTAPGAEPVSPLTIDVTKILRRYGMRRLRPSAVEVVENHLLVLAGKERVLFETTLQGELLGWRRLAWPRHRQAEGLTVGDQGQLIIADEGRWLGGTVTIYNAAKP